MRFGLTRAIALCAALGLAGAALSACNSSSSEIVPPGGSASQAPVFASKGGVAPEGQRRAFTRRFGGAGSGDLAINAFLWRAALDTISFMPIATADPYGGAIITDWYAPPETPDERFKVNVLVQGAALRSGGVKVSLFRQARDASGLWTDAAVENNTAVDLENVILLRARELQQDQANQ